MILFYSRVISFYITKVEFCWIFFFKFKIDSVFSFHLTARLQWNFVFDFKANNKGKQSFNLFYRFVDYRILQEKFFEVSFIRWLIKLSIMVGIIFRSFWSFISYLYWKLCTIHKKKTIQSNRSYENTQLISCPPRQCEHLYFWW